MPTPKLLLIMLAALATGLASGCASAPATRPQARRTQAQPAQPPQSAQPTQAAQAALASASAQVVAAERAFAKSMADRNFQRFLSYLSLDAVFFNGNSVERGRAQIAQVWAPYFAARRAPFSWSPDHVEVVPDGTLALSTGSLLRQGRIVGRFNSIWRLEAPDTWHIVFDKGEAVCSAPTPAGGAG